MLSFTFILYQKCIELLETKSWIMKHLAVTFFVFENIQLACIIYIPVFVSLPRFPLLNHSQEEYYILGPVRPVKTHV